MISVILPALPEHRNELKSSINSLIENSGRLGISELIIVINGASRETARTEEAGEGVVVQWREIPLRGLGHAYRTGIECARGDYVFLTHSDLPFGLSDLEAITAAMNAGRFPDELLAIGSKWHAQSRMAGYPKLRLLLSHLFYRVRRLCFGSVTPRDSQGTIFMPAAAAKEAAALSRSAGFFFTTEMVQRVAGKIRFEEFPVTLDPAQANARRSSVRPLRDGLTMLAEAIGLGRELGTGIFRR